MRVVTLRGTIHLMTVPDAVAIRPLVQAVLERGLTSQKERREALEGADLDAIAAAGRPLLDAEALTPKELGARLAEQFPGDRSRTPWPPSCATGCRRCRPRPAPCGAGRARPRLMTLDAWVTGGARRRADAAGRTPWPLDEVVRRYLAAFGPASVKDVQVWSGLTRLREVVDAMDDELRRVRRRGRRRALRPVPRRRARDADIDAPVRLVGEFDNLLLSHADRRRFLADEDRPRLATLNGIQPSTLLVDGEVAGWWRTERAKGVDHRRRPALAAAAPRAPGRRSAPRPAACSTLVAPDLERRDVRIMDP